MRFFAALSLIFLAFAVDVSGQVRSYPETQYLPPAADNGELLVDFHNEESSAGVVSLLTGFGLKASQFSWFSEDEKWLRLTQVTSDIFSRLKSNPRVEFVEPNYYFSALYVPNDPYYKHQWHLDLIGMQEAWEYPRGSSVTVAVIDTGIAYEKFQDSFRAEDLGDSQFVSPYNFLRRNEHANDDHGHGTHVAGTIAQLTNNGIGVAGVAPQVRIMPLKVLNSDGYGTLSDIAAAIRYAADHGAQVINMSLGAPFPSFILHKAIKYAHEKGVVIVCAAGNSGRSGLSYPAAYPECISVAAVRFDRELSWYSSYGKGLTISAPGGDMNVDQNGDGLMDGVLQNTLDPQDRVKQGYFLFQGTSMAAPHVAAVAALLVSHGIQDPEKVREYLRQSASPAAKDDPERYGAGVLNAQAALASAYSSRRSGILALALILFVTLVTLLNRGKSSWQKFPVGAPALLGLLLGSAGLYFLGWVPWLRSSFLLTHSAADWLIAFPFAGKWVTPLVLSVCLPLLVVVLFYPSKKLVPFAIGFSAGFAALLFHQAAFPSMDLSWIPGRLLDRGWWAIHGMLSLLLAVIASFRLR